MTKPAKERRKKIGATRFEVNMDVHLSVLHPQGTGFEGMGVIRNLSIRGALIETHTSVTTGDQLTLSVTLPNQADLLEIPQAGVRWVRGPQVGVEFLKLPAGISRILMKFLAAVHAQARTAQEDSTKQRG